MIVQDDSREEELANLFGLTRPGGRIDVDAFDEATNPFELKTTSKGSVSTARDLGYAHLDKWSQRYWIVADFTKLPIGHRFDRFWFLAPIHMAEWYAKIRAKLDADKEIAERAAIAMRLGGATENDILRVLRLCAEGALMNDPNIPKGYVRQNGVLLPEHSLKSSLKEMVLKYPL